MEVGCLDFLTDLQNLNQLLIIDMKVYDIEPILSLANLELLYLYDSHITEEQEEILRAALPGCAVYVDVDYTEIDFFND